MFKISPKRWKKIKDLNFQFNDMSEARKARRMLAKNLGYKAKTESLSSFRERVRRANTMGESLHVMHLQNMANSEIFGGPSSIDLHDDLILSNVPQEEEQIRFNLESSDFLSEYKPEESAQDEKESF